MKASSFFALLWAFSWFAAIWAYILLSVNIALGFFGTGLFWLILMFIVGSAEEYAADRRQAEEDSHTPEDDV